MTKKFSSFVLAIITVALVFCYPISSTADVDYSYKLDPVLKEKLNNMKNSDSIVVSVWLTDINNEEVTKKLKQKIGKEISHNIIDAVNYKDIDYSCFMKEKSTEQTKIESEQFQLAIETKRSIIADLQIKKNCAFLNKIFGSEKPAELVYSCKYLPNIEIKISKMQIMDIISYKEVNQINYIEESTPQKEMNSTVKSAKTTLRSENDSNIERNEDILDLTGISYLKNHYNLTGDGIKIGNIDWFLPFTDYINGNNIYCFDDVITDNRLHFVAYPNHVIDDTTGLYHQTLTTAVMAGKINNKYEGIACGADFYCAATGSPYSLGGSQYVPWKSRIDTLVGYGVNVINASMEAFGDLSNVYGDSAKWIDAMIATTNISFVQSVGNGSVIGDNDYRADYVISGAMAYNSIVVGSYNIDDNTISANSIYNSGNQTYKQFKPDIISPDRFTVWYNSTIYDNGGGTSKAAPVVTGAIALLFEKFPYLKANPAFLKSLLLNSARYLGTENTLNDTSVFVAFDRESGAGIINGKKAVSCIYSYGWSTGNMNAGLSFHDTVTVTADKYPVVVTVCAIKPVTFSGSSPYANSGTIDAVLPTFQISVTHSKTSNNIHYYSECNFDNKCSLYFTPTQGGTYRITITRTDSGTGSVAGAAFYTSVSDS